MTTHLPSRAPAPWRTITGDFPTIPADMDVAMKRHWARYVVDQITRAIAATPSGERSGLYALRRKWTIRADGGDARYDRYGTKPGPTPKKGQPA